MDGKIVVFGGSAGGVHALAKVLSALPRDIGAPIAAVLHRGGGEDDELAGSLQLSSSFPVREAEDKDVLEAGVVYVAPPGYHLLVDKGALALSTEAPIAWARPSIDVLFESAADAWGDRVIGVILTGGNSDGAQGLARIKECGGVTIAQEPSKAECPVMPNAAIAASRIDHVLPLEDIPPLLKRICPQISKTGYGS